MDPEPRQQLAAAGTYGCVTCGAQIASDDRLVSRQFNGHVGRAYLFEATTNVDEGEIEERHMTTGLHTCRAICCTGCQTLLGWKYETATEPSQRYKEGKYVVEQTLVRRGSGAGHGGTATGPRPAGEPAFPPSSAAVAVADASTIASAMPSALPT